jgi:hypothetical protein
MDMWPSPAQTKLGSHLHTLQHPESNQNNYFASPMIANQPRHWQFTPGKRPEFAQDLYKGGTQEPSQRGMGNIDSNGKQTALCETTFASSE